MTKTLSDHLGTFHYCQNCPVLTIFEVSHKYGHVQHYFEIWRQPTGSTYRIHMYPKELKIKKIIGAKHTTFLTLNFLPNINPNNVEAWLERIIKLQVFS